MDDDDDDDDNDDDDDDDIDDSIRNKISKMADKVSKLEDWSDCD